MKFYDLNFDEQIEELDAIWCNLQNTIDEMETDNPFYTEIIDIMNRVHDEKKETEERMPKDDTNEFLTREYWKNQL